MRSHLMFKNFIFAFFTILLMIGFSGITFADQVNSNVPSTNPSQSTISAPTPTPGNKPSNNYPTTNPTTPTSNLTTRKSNTNSIVNSSINQQSPKNTVLSSEAGDTKSLQPSTKVEDNLATVSSDTNDTQGSSQVKVATITSKSNSSTADNNKSKLIDNNNNKNTKTVKLTTPTKTKDVIEKSSFSNTILPKTGITKINLSMNLLLCGGLTFLIYIPVIVMFFNTISN